MFKKFRKQLQDKNRRTHPKREVSALSDKLSDMPRIAEISALDGPDGYDLAKHE